MAASRERKFWSSKYQINFLVCSVGRMQKMPVAYNCEEKKSRKQQEPILEIRDLYKALAKPMHHFRDTRSLKKDSSRTSGSPVTVWPTYSPQVSQFVGVSDPDLANDLISVWQYRSCSCQWPPPSPRAKNEHPMLALYSFIKCPWSMEMLMTCLQTSMERKSAFT